MKTLRTIVETTSNQLADELMADVMIEPALHNFLIETFEQVKGQRLAPVGEDLTFETPLQFFHFVQRCVTNSLIQLAREEEHEPEDTF